MFDNKYEKLFTEKLLQDKNVDNNTKQTLMNNYYKEYQYDVNDLSGAEQIDELWHIQATGQSSGKARYSHLVKEQERKDSNVDVKNYITQYLQNTAIQDNDSIFNRQVSNSFFQENNEDMLQAVKQSRELTIKKYVDKALEDKELKDILSNKNLSLDYKFNAIKNLEQKDKTLSYKTKQAFTNLKNSGVEIGQSLFGDETNLNKINKAIDRFLNPTEDDKFAMQMKLQDEINQLRRVVHTLEVGKNAYNIFGDDSGVKKFASITAREGWLLGTNFLSTITDFLHSVLYMDISSKLGTIDNLLGTNFNKAFQKFNKLVIENALSHLGYMTINSNDYSELLDGKISNMFEKYDGKGWGLYSKTLATIGDSLAMFSGSKAVAKAEMLLGSKIAKAITTSVIASASTSAFTGMIKDITEGKSSAEDLIFNAVGTVLPVALYGYGSLGKTFKTTHPKKVIDRALKEVDKISKKTKSPKWKKVLKDYANSSYGLSSAVYISAITKSTYEARMRNNNYDPEKIFDGVEWNKAIIAGVVAGTVENFAMQLINQGVKKEIINKTLLEHKGVFNKVFQEISKSIGWETIANAFETGFQSTFEQIDTTKGINWGDVFNAIAVGGLQGGIGAGAFGGLHRGFQSLTKSGRDKLKSEFYDTYEDKQLLNDKTLIGIDEIENIQESLDNRLQHVASDNISSVEKIDIVSNSIKNEIETLNKLKKEDTNNPNLDEKIHNLNLELKLVEQFQKLSKSDEKAFDSIEANIFSNSIVGNKELLERNKKLIKTLQNIQTKINDDNSLMKDNLEKLDQTIDKGLNSGIEEAIYDTINLFDDLQQYASAEDLLKSIVENDVDNIKDNVLYKLIEVTNKKLEDTLGLTPDKLKLLQAHVSDLHSARIIGTISQFDNILNDFENIIEDRKLANDLYNALQTKENRKYFADLLGISVDEFKNIFTDSANTSKSFFDLFTFFKKQDVKKLDSILSKIETKKNQEKKVIDYETNGIKAYLLDYVDNLVRTAKVERQIDENPDVFSEDITDELKNKVISIKNQISHKFIQTFKNIKTTEDLANLFNYDVSSETSKTDFYTNNQTIDIDPTNNIQLQYDSSTNNLSIVKNGNDMLISYQVDTSNNNELVFNTKLGDYLSYLNTTDIDLIPFDLVSNTINNSSNLLDIDKLFLDTFINKIKVLDENKLQEVSVDQNNVDENNIVLDDVEGKVTLTLNQAKQYLKTNVFLDNLISDNSQAYNIVKNNFLQDILKNENNEETKQIKVARNEIIKAKTKKQIIDAYNNLINSVKDYVNTHSITNGQKLLSDFIVKLELDKYNALSHLYQSSAQAILLFDSKYKQEKSQREILKDIKEEPNKLNLLKNLFEKIKHLPFIKNYTLTLKDTGDISYLQLFSLVNADTDFFKLKRNLDFTKQELNNNYQTLLRTPKNIIDETDVDYLENIKNNENKLNRDIIQTLENNISLSNINSLTGKVLNIIQSEQNRNKDITQITNDIIDDLYSFIKIYDDNFSASKEDLKHYDLAKLIQYIETNPNMYSVIRDLDRMVTNQLTTIDMTQFKNYAIKSYKDLVSLLFTQNLINNEPLQKTLESLVDNQAKETLQNILKFDFTKINGTDTKAKEIIKNVLTNDQVINAILTNGDQGLANSTKLLTSILKDMKVDDKYIKDIISNIQNISKDIFTYLSQGASIQFTLSNIDKYTEDLFAYQGFFQQIHYLMKFRLLDKNNNLNPTTIFRKFRLYYNLINKILHTHTNNLLISLEDKYGDVNALMSEPPIDRQEIWNAYLINSNNKNDKFIKKLVQGFNPTLKEKDIVITNSIKQNIEGIFKLLLNISSKSQSQKDKQVAITQIQETLKLFINNLNKKVKNEEDKYTTDDLKQMAEDIYELNIVDNVSDMLNLFEKILLGNKQFSKVLSTDSLKDTNVQLQNVVDFVENYKELFVTLDSLPSEDIYDTIDDLLINLRNGKLPILQNRHNGYYIFKIDNVDNKIYIPTQINNKDKTLVITFDNTIDLNANLKDLQLNLFTYLENNKNSILQYKIYDNFSNPSLFSYLSYYGIVDTPELHNEIKNNSNIKEDEFYFTYSHIVEIQDNGKVHSQFELVLRLMYNEVNYYHKSPEEIKELYNMYRLQSEVIQDLLGKFTLHSNFRNHLETLFDNNDPLFKKFFDNLSIKDKSDIKAINFDTLANHLTYFVFSNLDKIFSVNKKEHTITIKDRYTFLFDKLNIIDKIIEFNTSKGFLIAQNKLELMSSKLLKNVSNNFKNIAIDEFFSFKYKYNKDEIDFQKIIEDPSISSRNKALLYLINNYKSLLNVNIDSNKKRYILLKESRNKKSKTTTYTYFDTSNNSIIIEDNPLNKSEVYQDDINDIKIDISLQDTIKDQDLYDRLKKELLFRLNNNDVKDITDVYLNKLLDKYSIGKESIIDEDILNNFFSLYSITYNKDNDNIQIKVNPNTYYWDNVYLSGNIVEHEYLETVGSFFVPSNIDYYNNLNDFFVDPELDSVFYSYKYLNNIHNSKNINNKDFILEVNPNRLDDIDKIYSTDYSFFRLLLDNDINLERLIEEFNSIDEYKDLVKNYKYKAKKLSNVYKLLNLITPENSSNKEDIKKSFFNFFKIILSTSNDNFFGLQGDNPSILKDYIQDINSEQSKRFLNKFKLAYALNLLTELTYSFNSINISITDLRDSGLSFSEYFTKLLTGALSPYGLLTINDTMVTEVIGTTLRQFGLEVKYINNAINNKPDTTTMHNKIIGSGRFSKKETVAKLLEEAQLIQSVKEDTEEYQQVKQIYKQTKQSAEELYSVNPNSSQLTNKDIDKDTNFEENIPNLYTVKLLDNKVSNFKKSFTDKYKQSKVNEDELNTFNLFRGIASEQNSILKYLAETLINSTITPAPIMPTKSVKKMFLTLGIQYRQYEELQKLSKTTPLYLSNKFFEIGEVLDKVFSAKNENELSNLLSSYEHLFESYGVGRKQLLDIFKYLKAQSNMGKENNEDFTLFNIFNITNKFKDDIVPTITIIKELEKIYFTYKTLQVDGLLFKKFKHYYSLESNADHKEFQEAFSLLDSNNVNELQSFYLKQVIKTNDVLTLKEVAQRYFNNKSKNISDKLMINLFKKEIHKWLMTQLPYYVPRYVTSNGRYQIDNLFENWHSGKRVFRGIMYNKPLDKAPITFTDDTTKLEQIDFIRSYVSSFQQYADLGKGEYVPTNYPLYLLLTTTDLIIQSFGKEAYDYFARRLVGNEPVKLNSYKSEQFKKFINALFNKDSKTLKKIFTDNFKDTSKLSRLDIDTHYNIPPIIKQLHQSIQNDNIDDVIDIVVDNVLDRVAEEHGYSGFFEYFPGLFINTYNMFYINDSIKPEIFSNPNDLIEIFDKKQIENRTNVTYKLNDDSLLKNKTFYQTAFHETDGKTNGTAHLHSELTDGAFINIITNDWNTKKESEKTLSALEEIIKKYAKQVGNPLTFFYNLQNNVATGFKDHIFGNMSAKENDLIDILRQQSRDFILLYKIRKIYIEQYSKSFSSFEETENYLKNNLDYELEVIDFLLSKATHLVKLLDINVDESRNYYTQKELDNTFNKLMEVIQPNVSDKSDLKNTLTIQNFNNFFTDVNSFQDLFTSVNKSKLIYHSQTNKSKIISRLLYNRINNDLLKNIDNIDKLEYVNFVIKDVFGVLHGGFTEDDLNNEHLFYEKINKLIIKDIKFKNEKLNIDNISEYISEVHKQLTVINTISNNMKNTEDNKKALKKLMSDFSYLFIDETLNMTQISKQIFTESIKNEYKIEYKDGVYNVDNFVKQTNRQQRNFKKRTIEISKLFPASKKGSNLNNIFSNISNLADDGGLKVITHTDSYEALGSAVISLAFSNPTNIPDIYLKYFASKLKRKMVKYPQMHSNFNASDRSIFQLHGKDLYEDFFVKYFKNLVNASNTDELKDSASELFDIFNYFEQMLDEEKLLTVDILSTLGFKNSEEFENHKNTIKDYLKTIKTDLEALMENDQLTSNELLIGNNNFKSLVKTIRQLNTQSEFYNILGAVEGQLITQAIEMLYPDIRVLSGASKKIGEDILNIYEETYDVYNSIIGSIDTLFNTITEKYNTEDNILSKNIKKNISNTINMLLNSNDNELKEIGEYLQDILYQRMEIYEFLQTALSGADKSATKKEFFQFVNTPNTVDSNGHMIKYHNKQGLAFSVFFTHGLDGKAIVEATIENNKNPNNPKVYDIFDALLSTIETQRQASNIFEQAHYTSKLSNVNDKRLLKNVYSLFEEIRINLSKANLDKYANSKNLSISQLIDLTELSQNEKDNLKKRFTTFLSNNSKVFTTFKDIENYNRLTFKKELSKYLNTNLNKYNSLPSNMLQVVRNMEKPVKALKYLTNIGHQIINTIDNTITDGTLKDELFSIIGNTQEQLIEISLEATKEGKKIKIPRIVYIEILNSLKNKGKNPDDKTIRDEVNIYLEDNSLTIFNKSLSDWIDFKGNILLELSPKLDLTYHVENLFEDVENNSVDTKQLYYDLSSIDLSNYEKENKTSINPVDYINSLVEDINKPEFTTAPNYINFFMSLIMTDKEYNQFVKNNTDPKNYHSLMDIASNINALNTSQYRNILKYIDENLVSKFLNFIQDQSNLTALKDPKLAKQLKNKFKVLEFDLEKIDKLNLSINERHKARVSTFFKYLALNRKLFGIFLSLSNVDDLTNKEQIYNVLKNPEIKLTLNNNVTNNFIQKFFYDIINVSRDDVNSNNTLANQLLKDKKSSIDKINNQLKSIYVNKKGNKNIIVNFGSKVPHKDILKGLKDTFLFKIDNSYYLVHKNNNLFYVNSDISNKKIIEIKNGLIQNSKLLDPNSNVRVIIDSNIANIDVSNIIKKTIKKLDKKYKFHNKVKLNYMILNKKRTKLFKNKYFTQFERKEKDSQQSLAYLLDNSYNLFNPHTTVIDTFQYQSNNKLMAGSNKKGNLTLNEILAYDRFEYAVKKSDKKSSSSTNSSSSHSIVPINELFSDNMKSHIENLIDLKTTEDPNFAYLGSVDYYGKDSVNNFVEDTFINYTNHFAPHLNQGIENLRQQIDNQLNHLKDITNEDTILTVHYTNNVNIDEIQYKADIVNNTIHLFNVPIKYANYKLNETKDIQNLSNINNYLSLLHGLPKFKELFIAIKNLQLDVTVKTKDDIEDMDISKVVSLVEEIFIFSKYADNLFNLLNTLGLNNVYSTLKGFYDRFNISRNKNEFKLIHEELSNYIRDIIKDDSTTDDNSGKFILEIDLLIQNLIYPYFIDILSPLINDKLQNDLKINPQNKILNDIFNFLTTYKNKDYFSKGLDNVNLINYIFKDFTNNIDYTNFQYLFNSNILEHLIDPTKNFKFNDISLPNYLKVWLLLKNQLDTNILFTSTNNVFDKQSLLKYFHYNNIPYFYIEKGSDFYVYIADDDNPKIFYEFKIDKNNNLFVNKKEGLSISIKGIDQNHSDLYYFKDKKQTIKSISTISISSLSQLANKSHESANLSNTSGMQNYFNEFLGNMEEELFHLNTSFYFSNLGSNQETLEDFLSILYLYDYMKNNKDLILNNIQDTNVKNNIETFLNIYESNKDSMTIVNELFALMNRNSEIFNVVSNIFNSIKNNLINQKQKVEIKDLLDNYYIGEVSSKENDKGSINYKKLSDISIFQDITIEDKNNKKYLKFDTLFERTLINTILAKNKKEFFNHLQLISNQNKELFKKYILNPNFKKLNSIPNFYTLAYTSSNPESVILNSLTNFVPDTYKQVAKQTVNELSDTEFMYNLLGYNGDEHNEIMYQKLSGKVIQGNRDIKSFGENIVLELNSYLKDIIKYNPNFNNLEELESNLFDLFTDIPMNNEIYTILHSYYSSTYTGLSLKDYLKKHITDSNKQIINRLLSKHNLDKFNRNKNSGGFVNNTILNKKSDDLVALLNILDILKLTEYLRDDNGDDTYLNYSPILNGYDLLITENNKKPTPFHTKLLSYEDNGKEYTIWQKYKTGGDYTEGIFSINSYQPNLIKDIFDQPKKIPHSIYKQIMTIKGYKKYFSSTIARTAEHYFRNKTISSRNKYFLDTLVNNSNLLLYRENGKLENSKRIMYKEININELPLSLQDTFSKYKNGKLYVHSSFKSALLGHKSISVIDKLLATTEFSDTVKSVFKYVESFWTGTTKLIMQNIVVKTTKYILGNMLAGIYTSYINSGTNPIEYLNHFKNGLVKFRKIKKEVKKAIKEVIKEYRTTNSLNDIQIRDLSKEIKKRLPIDIQDLYESPMIQTFVSASLLETSQGKNFTRDVVFDGLLASTLDKFPLAKKLIGYLGGYTVGLLHTPLRQKLTSELVSGKDIVDEFMMFEDSYLGQFTVGISEMFDFAGRYAIYESNGKTDKAMVLAQDTMIDFARPLPPLFEALNRYGVLPYASFVLRTNKAILSTIFDIYDKDKSLLQRIKKGKAIKLALSDMLGNHILTPNIFENYGLLETNAYNSYQKYFIKNPINIIDTIPHIWTTDIPNIDKLETYIRISK